MNKTVGVILNNPDIDLGELTEVRGANTLPFGGRYRLVDFALSNFVNSGIRKIGVFASDKYRSLVDHLGTGQEWSLSRKSQDLITMQGSAANYLARQRCYINLMEFNENMGFITRTMPENVVIASSNLVANLDIEQLIEYHEKMNADVTLLTKKQLAHQTADAADLGVGADESGRVSVLSPGNAKGCDHVYLEIMVIRTSLLFRAIKQSTVINSYDLIDILSRMVRDLQIYSYEYTGYIRVIRSLKSYYQASMDLLNPSIAQRLFRTDRQISTKIKDNPPTAYGGAARVNHSLIASGCNIEGTVSGSVLFRMVDVGGGTIIRDSILMEACHIGRNVILEHVILDRGVTVSDEVVLQGTQENPVVIRKGDRI